MSQALLLGCVATVSACIAGDATSSTSQASTAYNRLSSNRLSSNRLSSNRLSSNRLSSNRLSSNSLHLDPNGAHDLLATDDGRNVLSYIVGCAVPEGTILVGESGACSVNADCVGTLSTGTCNAGACTYEFPGQLGLAPEWLGKKLSREGKGWISACIFSRVNAHDTAEEISLHGEHPELTVSVGEAMQYTVEEGAFYGNLFTPNNEPIAWYACRGEGQAAGESGGLVLRDCAEPDPANPHITQCGFNYAGDCADFTPLAASPYACAERESGDPDDHHGQGDPDHDGDGSHGGITPPADHGFYYEGCHTSSGLGTWHHAREFDQVITTFVSP